MKQIVWSAWELMKLNSDELFIFETQCPVSEKQVKPGALQPWN